MSLLPEFRRFLLRKSVFPFYLLVLSCLSGCSKLPEPPGNAWADSVTWYTELAKELPNDPVIIYNRGIYQFRLGKYPEALSDFSNAIRMNPGFYAAYLPRGDCHRMMGNDAEAVANYDTSLANTGGSAYLYRMRAWCQFRLRNYPSAVSDYTKLLMLSGDDGMVYGLRGRSRYYNKEYAAAADDLTKAVKLSPDSAFLYVWLGNAQYRQDLWNECLLSYQTAIEKKADMSGENFLPQAYLARAKLLQDDDPAQALKDINECIARDSSSAEAYYIRGKIVFELGDAESGCADLRTAGMMGYIEAFETMKDRCSPVK